MPQYQPSIPPKTDWEAKRMEWKWEKGRRRKARCQGAPGRGLLSGVNIFQKWCFVPQTSCLQQQGLIQALCANTSVALDPPLHRHTSARIHARTHTYKHTHFLVTEAHSPPPIPPPPFFFYRSKLSKLCLKVNEGWLALSLPFSRSLSPSRFDISVFFSLLATVSGLGDNCR